MSNPRSAGLSGVPDEDERVIAAPLLASEIAGKTAHLRPRPLTASELVCRAHGVPQACVAPGAEQGTSSMLEEDVRSACLRLASRARPLEPRTTVEVARALWGFVSRRGHSATSRRLSAVTIAYHEGADIADWLRFAEEFDAFLDDPQGDGQDYAPSGSPA